MELIDAVGRIVELLAGWRRSPQPVAPEELVELVLATDRLDAKSPVEELPLLIAVATLRENLRAFECGQQSWERLSADTQPTDGSPGPRIWATLKLLDQRHRLATAAAPAPISFPGEENVMPQLDFPKTTRLETLLRELEAVTTDEIDDEIASLQMRIDDLNRLRQIKEPSAKRTAASGAKRSKAEMQQFLESLQAHLKTPGKKTVAEVSQHFSMLPASMRSLINRNSDIFVVRDGGVHLVDAEAA